MYRSRVVLYLPWIVLLPVIFYSIGFYLGFTSPFIIYLGFVTYGIVTSLVFYVYLKLERVIYYSNKYGLDNVELEYNLEGKKKYTGIVIVHKNYSDKKSLVTYLSSPMLLIEYLKYKKESYKLIIDPARKDFEKIVEDPNCNKLYIMGHGRLYRFIIGPNKEDTIWYKDFIGYPKKDKVVQLHCNHRDCFFKNRELKNLTEILNADSDFNKKGMITNLNILDYFLSMVEQ